jgi:hypothetical protein
MELQDLLPAVIIICATILAVGFLSQVVGSIGNTDSLPMANESLTMSTTIATSFGETPLDTPVFKNLDGSTTYGSSNFVVSLPTSDVLLAVAPFTTGNITFNSFFDKNVSSGVGNIAFVSTAKVYNCTNASELWNSTTDYTMYSPDGKILVKSTGNMLNATAYCTNYNYRMLDNGAVVYAYYDYTGQAVSDTNSLEALGIFGQWVSIIIAVVISIVVIGILAKLNRND